MINTNLIEDLSTDNGRTLPVALAKVCDSCNQLAWLDGLRYEHIESGRQCARTILDPNQGGQRHGGNLATALLFQLSDSTDQ